jgi:DNA-directed RNA polymerase subunit M/transcription elongation factor TFIIS
MYYIAISEKKENNLVYYCRNCGHRDETIANEGICILDTKANQGEQKFNHIINKYTKFDPTLPRIYNIHCPNEVCKTNEHSPSPSHKTPAEIIYIRYDDSQLKYLYLCSTCDMIWKTNDNSKN